MKIKAQRSLQTTQPVPQALFYDKDRSWQWEGPVPGNWVKIFDTNGPRFFAAVEWKEQAKAPKFKHLIPEQGW